MNQVSLSDVYWFQEGPGVRNWQFKESGIKLLNVANITKQGKIDLDKTDRHLSTEEVDSKYQHFLIDEGDLVIASSGITNDEDNLLRTKIAFIEKQHLPLCLNTSTIRFKAKDGVSDLKFLKHWLNSLEFRQQITKEVTGIAQKNFGPSHLKKIKISLPPLTEQRRIASILDQADELRQKRQQAIEKLDQFLQATFIDMFGDPKINPYKFNIEKLSKFYIDSKNGTKCGPFGSALKRHEYVEDGIPVWSMDVITLSGEFIDNPSLWVTNEKFRELESYSVEQGDVIISRAGTVGKMGVVHSQYDKSLISTNLIRLRFGKKLLPEYFVALMTYCKHRLSRLQTGADGAFTHMNTGILDNLEFPYPPIEKQKQFVDFLHMVNNNKQILLESYKRMNDLFVSIQHQAFSGTL